MLLCASTAEGKPKIVRIGHVGTEGSPWDNAIQNEVRTWKTRSKGRLLPKVYPGGAVGTESRHIKLCQNGELAIVGVSDFSLGQIIPEINVLSVPFLFRNDAEVDHAIDEVVAPALRRIMREHRLELFALSQHGWLDLATSRSAPIRLPEDINGLKVRVPVSPFYITLAKTLGASPVPLSIHEVMAGLEDGRVSGILHSPIYLVATGWYQRLRFLSKTHVAYSTAMILMNRDFHDELPPDLRRVVMGRRHVVRDFVRSEARSMDRDLEESLDASGVSLYTHTNQELDAFRRLAYSRRAAIEAPLGKRGRALLRRVERALRAFRKRASNEKKRAAAL